MGRMPRLASKKQGSGKVMLCTGILNMSDVARALKRDPVYVMQFIGYDLGVKTSYTNKDSEGERAIVNGHHETQALQSLIDKFIDKYVLCRNCNYPEIDMYVNKKGIVMAQCKACGWNGDLDNDHKLANYIAKHPPDTGIGFDAEKKKDRLPARRKAKRRMRRKRRMKNQVKRKKKKRR